MSLLKKTVLGAIGGILAVYLIFAIGLTVLEWIVRENPKVAGCQGHRAGQIVPRSGLLGESPLRQQLRFLQEMPIANMFDFLL